MPAAVAIPAIIGALGVGGSVASGIIGSNAAKKAAATQQAAAQQAGNLVTSTVANTNPALLEAAGNAGGAVTTTAGNAAAGVSSAADRANALLNPYAATGETATNLMNTGLSSGDLASSPTMAQLQMDPGYAFRLQQGQLALERSAAARGGVTSGGYLKSLTDYSQGAASQEYQNAFNRFEQDRQNRFGNLLSASGQGLGASNTEGQNLMNAGTYGGNAAIDASKYSANANIAATNQASQNTIGAANSAANYLTQGANANAAGQVGSANAITGAIGSGINSLSGAASLGNLLRNPALAGSGGGVTFNGAKIGGR